jgi:cysteinyl-tRNA synthetase
MSLKIYNTLTGKKENFIPLTPDTVKMYVCGPTVYNRVHIGNARPAVVFDTLFRVLQTQYDNVIYASNITDIDDKIMNTAKDNNESISDVSARYTAAYFEDMAQLNNLKPTITPFATEHVSEMINMVETLVNNGHAYAAEGHVLFDVQSMDDYGKLSNRSLEDMLAGARVEVAAYKKYAGDFVLWKPSTEDEPGWDSPWGRGRPGWHLECSAMIEKHLGNTIDIHGGGIDLQFPHHENEIAQSSCAHNGEQFVRYWMHNAYINIDGEKMSKSLGNFRMINELLEHYSGEVIRFAILSAHYRSELNFSADLLDNAKKSLDTFYNALRNAQEIKFDSSTDISDSTIYQALLDDLNTPIAIREMHAIVKALKTASDDDKVELKSRLLKASSLMGLLQQDPEEWFHVDVAEGALSDQAIDDLVTAMNQARTDKDYATADKLRNELTEQGITLTREGWKRS